MRGYSRYSVTWNSLVAGAFGGYSAYSVESSGCARHCCVVWSWGSHGRGVYGTRALTTGQILRDYRGHHWVYIYILQTSTYSDVHSPVTRTPFKRHVTPGHPASDITSRYGNRMFLITLRHLSRCRPHPLQNANKRVG